MAEKHETTRRGSSTRHRRLRALAGLAAALCVVAIVGAVVPGLLAEDDAVQDAQSLLSYSQDEIQTIAWTYDGTQSQVAYEDDGWVDTADGEQLDQDEVGAIAEALADATVTRSIDEADVTDEMGLDDPSATASITFTDGTSAELRIGAPTSDEAAYYASVDDEGAYYAQPEGSSKVYAISASVVEELTGTKVEDMLPDDVLLMDWTEVTSMEVSTGGVTKTIDFEHTRSEDDEDGDGEADVETAYTVDGQECDASEVEELLDALDALETEDVVQDAEPAEAAVRIVFYRDTETYSEMELNLSRYDKSSGGPAGRCRCPC